VVVNDLNIERLPLLPTKDGSPLDKDPTAVRPWEEVRRRLLPDRLLFACFPVVNFLFSKDDSNAEDIVEVIRDEFGRGNTSTDVAFATAARGKSADTPLRTDPFG
jgi:hypothetical protein